jgi:hypothetical protein
MKANQKLEEEEGNDDDEGEEGVSVSVCVFSVFSVFSVCVCVCVCVCVMNEPNEWTTCYSDNTTCCECYGTNNHCSNKQTRT